MQEPLPRVLLVEGNAQLRGFLTLVLRQCGCEVEAVADCRDALKYAQVGFFSLVIADTSLPDGPGLELCREIRSIHPGVPVVICNSSGVKGEVTLEGGPHESLAIGDFMTWQLQQLLNQFVKRHMVPAPAPNKAGETEPVLAPVQA